MLLFANNATAFLAAAVAAGDTTLNLQSGQGALFPLPVNGDYFYLTLSSNAAYEVVKVTARNADALTVVRAQDGTAAQAFKAYDRASVNLPRIGLQQFVQRDQNLADLPNIVTARSNLGLGSLALQNSTALSVTGGTINGTVIGGTTPAAITGTTGTFTSTLSVAGTATIGGQLIANGTQPSGTYNFEAIGASGAARSILLAAQAGFSNGFTVDYNGSNMIYALRDGRVLVNGATDDASTALQVAGGGKFTSNLDLRVSASYNTVNPNGLYLGNSNSDASNSNTPAYWLINATGNAANQQITLTYTPRNSAGTGFGSPVVAAQIGYATASFVGRMLINGVTDDGATALQVAGNGLFTGIGKFGPSAGYQIQIQKVPNSIDAYNNGAGSALWLQQNTSKNVIIGNIPDNGAQTLQVAGSGNFNSYLVVGGDVSTGGAFKGSQDKGVIGLMLGRYSSANPSTYIQLVDTSGGSNHPTSLIIEDGGYNTRFTLNSDGRIFSTNRMMVNGATDNGSDALQVNGYGNFQAASASAQIKFGRTVDSVGGGRIGGDSGYMFRVYDAAASANPFNVTQAGRVLVGTSTDNGADALQVNGGIWIPSNTNMKFGPNCRIAAGSNDVDLFFTSSGWFYFGANICPSTDNSYTLGQPSVRFAAVYAANGTIQTSDRTQKKAIEDSQLGLDFINSLRPVSYRWKDKSADNGVHYGLIAQEVNDLLQRIGVQSFAGLSKPKDGPMGLQYSEFIAPLIRAVQELSNRVKQLEKGAA